MFVVLLSQFSLLDFLESSPFDCFVLFCFVLFLLPFLSHFFLIAWFGLKASLYYQPFSLISVVLCTIPLLLSSLAFSRTPIIPLDTYVTSVSDSPQRSRKKICLVLVLVPFYPLSSTLYPLSPPAFDASNDDNGHYTYTLYHLRSLFNYLHITRIPLLVFWFWFFWFTQTDRLGSRTLLLFSFYTNGRCTYTQSQVKSSILNFEHEHEWLYTDSHYTLTLHTHTPRANKFFFGVRDLFGPANAYEHTNTNVYTAHRRTMLLLFLHKLLFFFSDFLFFFFFF